MSIAIHPPLALPLPVRRGPRAALLLAALVTSLCGCGSTAPAEPDPQPDDALAPARYAFPDDADAATAALPFVEDELIVQAFPGVTTDEVDEAAQLAGASVVDRISELSVTRLRIARGAQAEVAEQLAATGAFESLNKNYILTAEATPNDPSYVQQPYLGQINLPHAWDVTTGAEDVLIAIVDSGVESTHPDLAGKITEGWNVRTNSADYRDVKGHGTLVAGTAAAMSDNAVGVSGVAWENPILAVRVSDDAGQATARDVAAGILWATNRGAKVINVSFAPLWSNTLVKSACEHAFNRGSLVVISAGNGGGTQTATGYDEGIFVAALDGTNQLATFSDRGPFVDISAPGRAIYSTAIGASYRAADGTSFAAPIVSGVLALAWSMNPALRPATVRDLLLDEAIDLGSGGVNSTFGHGAVDAGAVLDAAESAVFTPDTTAPSVRFTSPRAGTSLRGRAAIKATAADNVGVADVLLEIDGIPQATDTRKPYEFAINTALFSAGAHTLAITATDLDGNRSAKQTLSASFARGSITGSGGASTITFRTPAANATVSGDVLVEASISDSDGLAVVEWFVDGTSVSTTSVGGTSSVVSYLWRGAASTSGAHLISVQVLDGRGEATSANLALNRG